MKDVKQTVTLTVEYRIGVQDAARGSFSGGVSHPKYMNELYFGVFDDIVGDGPSGKTQINLWGSRRAYREFARYLLALTAYSKDRRLRDPDYHGHYDNARNNDGEPLIHLIVHAPRSHRGG
jgi:hypothetical protein